MNRTCPTAWNGKTRDISLMRRRGLRTFAKKASATATFSPRCAQSRSSTRSGSKTRPRCGTSTLTARARKHRGTALISMSRKSRSRKESPGGRTRRRQFSPSSCPRRSWSPLRADAITARAVQKSWSRRQVQINPKPTPAGPPFTKRPTQSSLREHPAITLT